jgi:hypothetical protein
MLEIILNYVYECLGEKSPGVPYLLKFQSSGVESENYSLVIQKIRLHSGDPENYTTLWWSRNSDHALVIYKISNTAMLRPSQVRV